MIAYPAKFTPEEGAFTVTFPDIPEAITCGYSPAEAMAVRRHETSLYVSQAYDGCRHSAISFSSIAPALITFQ
jgi:hypothetical protein